MRTIQSHKIKLKIKTHKISLEKEIKKFYGD